MSIEPQIGYTYYDKRAGFEGWSFIITDKHKKVTDSMYTYIGNMRSKSLGIIGTELHYLDLVSGYRLCPVVEVQLRFKQELNELLTEPSE